MASAASRALLLASLRPLPSYRIVRPLAAAGTLLPARPWLSQQSPSAVAPETAAVRRFATRRAASSSSSSSSSPRENSRLPSSRPPEETVAIDGADSDSEDYPTSSDYDDESEETWFSDELSSSEYEPTSDDDSDDDVERKSSSSGGSATEMTNYRHRPPKEMILLDGCDFEHWLVVMEPPPGDPSDPDVARDEIIDCYIKTLAQVLGSEEKARKKIYSVSTRHYFAFGALVPEELSYKLKELPKVRHVLPDSYLDAENKDYGGEPFINGKAVPYDPKYHEEWVRNNARAMQRDLRRKENMENIQNRDVPIEREGSNSPSPPEQQTMAQRDGPPMAHHAHGSMPPPPPPKHGDPPTYQHHVQSPEACETAGPTDNSQQCGGAVHQVTNQDYPGARMHDDNQGCPNNHDDNVHSYHANAYKSNNNGYQGEWSGYQYGISADQPPLHGANSPPNQGGSAPGYQGQAVHHHYYYHVHNHYY